jgi:hypothetical protein
VVAHLVPAGSTKKLPWLVSMVVVVTWDAGLLQEFYTLEGMKNNAETVNARRSVVDVLAAMDSTSYGREGGCNRTLRLDYR